MADTERQSLAQKFNLHPVARDTQDLVDEDELELEEETEYTAFAVNKQANQRAEMLDIVFKDGSRRAFSYSHLYRIEYDPQDGIELHFSEHTVHVQGIRLLKGYRRLLTYRVIKIEQADGPTTKLLRDDGVVVTELEISKVESEPLV